MNAEVQGLGSCTNTVYAALCQFLSFCLHSTTPDDLSPALQTDDPGEGSETVRQFLA